MSCDISDLLIGIVSMGLGILMICIGCRRGFLGGMRMERRELAKKCARIEKAGGSVRDYLSEQGYISPWGTWFRLQKEELGRQKYQITDGKGQSEMRKITLADKKKAVEIALEGGNPLVFLKECGSKNPSAAWYVIKQTLKETDPETYERLPDLRKKDESKEEETMNEIHIDAEAVGAAEPVSMTNVRSVMNPVNYGGFEVCMVRDPKTGDTFSYDPKHNVMEWRTESGDDVVMAPEFWRALIGKLPDVMGILGI